MRDEQLTAVSFYIVAHADDWQLFMQPNVYNDIVASGKKVVFIITTAGDAGVGETFWSAREEGLKSSIRFCVCPREVATESTAIKVFNEHPLNCWSLNNVTSYFLRLPDGNLDGSGFPANNYHSLTRFKSQEIHYITAVDNSTGYANWHDFHTILEAIILNESDGISNIGVHYLDPDSDSNPGDHKDHAATGEAIQEMTTISTLRQTLYMGYSVGGRNSNLDPSNLFWKTGMFAAYEKAVYDLCGYSTLKEGISTYMKWCLAAAHSVTINPQV